MHRVLLAFLLRGIFNLSDSASSLSLKSLTSLIFIFVTLFLSFCIGNQVVIDSRPKVSDSTRVSIV